MTHSLKNRILARFRRPSPTTREVAAAVTTLAGNAFRTAGYSPDDLLTHRGLAIYDEMQRDAQVRACLNTKKFAVLSKGWDLRPATNSPQDTEIAEFVRFCLEDMRGSIADTLFQVLDALGKGFSILEINWKIIPDGPYSGMVGLDSIKSKDPAAFGFDIDEFLNIRSLVRESAELPAEKFIIYTYMPAYELPHGQSDLRAAYKHWYSKEIILKFWNLYLEKFGMPTAKGSYRRGMPKDQQDDLLRVLDRIQQETALVIPEDVKVELLEAQRGGEAGYHEAVEFHNKQIAKAILGQTLTTDEGSRFGSFGMAKVHFDILGFYLQKLKRDLEETVMREQVIRRLVNFNFAEGGCPQFVLGLHEEKDLREIGDLIVRLVEGRVIAPDEEWIREHLGLPEGKESKQ